MRRGNNCLGAVAILTASVLFIYGAFVMLRGCFTNEPSTFCCDSGYTLSEEQKPATTLEEFASNNGLTLDQWPDEIREMLDKNKETKDFVFNYPLLKDKDFPIDISDSLKSDSVPLFMQWDQRWGYTPYGDDIIAISGCGPTCLSMVSSYLLQDPSLDPKTVAEFSESNGYCAPGNGSFWTLISEGGERLGLTVNELTLDENDIKSNLEEGKPVICIMGPGDFTTGGHFIVMVDYIDGKIKINDPNSIANSEKLWDYSSIESQIDNLWACSAN